MYGIVYSEYVVVVCEQKELETISNELKVTAQPRAGARVSANGHYQDSEAAGSPSAKSSLLQSASSQRSLLVNGAGAGIGFASPTRVGVGASALRRMSLNELDGGGALAPEIRTSELSALSSDLTTRTSVFTMTLIQK